MKRRIIRSFFIILLLLCVGGLTGCAFETGLIPPPYTIITDLRGDPTPHHLYEHGKQKRLYRAQATIWWCFGFWPIEANGTDDYLFDHPVQNWQFWKGYAMRFMPRQRQLDVIQELAHGVSPVGRWARKNRDQARIRWILGNDPLVIAIGTDDVPIHSDTCILARDADLDRTATEILILPKWPPKWQMGHDLTEWENQFIRDLAPKTRHIPLDHPTTLRELLATAPWQSPTAPQSPISHPNSSPPVRD